MLNISVDALTGALARDVRNFAPQALAAGRIALNYGADRRAAPEMRRGVADQVNLSRAYVNTRIQVSKRATNDNLEAVVTARTRATSLARFAVGNPIVGARGPVSVQVKRGGQTRQVKGGFIIKLRSGASELGNEGLALRLGATETVRGKRFTARAIGGSGGKSRLYLLYGPSVQQVASSAAEATIDTIADAIMAEYDRQLSRLLTE